MAPSRATEWSPGLAALLVVALAGAWAALVAGPGEDAGLVLDSFLLVGGAFAAACALAAARRARGWDRTGWAFLGSAAGLWAASEGAWVIRGYALALPAAEFSFWDAGFLLYVPLASAGLLSLMHARHGPGWRRITALQAGVVSVSFFLSAWELAHEGVLVQGDRSVEFTVLSLAYPALDAGLATAAVLLAARAPAGARRPWVALAAGLTIQGLTDFAYTITSATGVAPWAYLSVGWIAGFSLLAAGARWSTTMPAAVERRADPLSNVSLAFTYAPLVVALGVVTYHTLGGHPIGIVEVGAAMLLAGFLSTAQVLSVVENRRLRAQAEQRLAALEESTVQRTQLMNMISHDLLNPLTPIAVQVHLLKRSPGGLTEKQAKSVEVIERNAAQMQRLIVDLKDLAKLQGGALAMKPQDVDLRELAQFAAASFAEAARAKGVTITTRLDDALPARADAGRIGQVLANLLSNAVKFTPSGGGIVVEGSREGTTARVSVRDTGRGLAADELPRLFKPFSQAHDPSEVPEKGTGLGLFISRGIAEQHGGSLRVESEGRGKGATFTLAIPLAPA